MKQPRLRKTLKKLVPKQAFRKVERQAHLAESVVYSVANRFPGRKLKAIGVTGTNGKTTTTNLIFTMMREAGYNVALLSSTAYGYKDDIMDEYEHMTTVPAPLLQKRLKEFVEKGAEWVVIEVSSHALAQYRTWSLPIEIAVMTNVTHEHLDYHGTFERYRDDKRKLFKLAARTQRGLGVVYAEDPAAELFLSTTPRGVSYGIDEGELRAHDIHLDVDHSTFVAKAGDDRYDITVALPGKFNVNNTLAAIAVGRELGLTKQQIEQGIAALKGVPGRMTVINEGQPYRVLIDYAGTPDAFEKVFELLRPMTKGKLVAVFGSPSERDLLKRPIQGEIAAKWADEVVLTEEEDRHESGQKIMEEIAAGATKKGMIIDKNLFLINNRTKAIEFAMTRVSSADDTVVTLGKSHEKTIERGDKIFPWDEPETVRRAIRKARKG